MEYKKIVSKKYSPHYYMKVVLEFDADEPPELTATQFKAVILCAENTLFGEVGQASIHVDVLKYREDKRSAILKVNGSGFVQLWSALTLCGAYGGQRCAFRVTQISSSLMALAANSRTFTHRPVQLDTDR